jgi:hypothetical protein
MRRRMGEVQTLSSRRWARKALRVVLPCGTLSSLGVYSTDLRIPLGPFAAKLAYATLVTTLSPGGKARPDRSGL